LSLLQKIKEALEVNLPFVVYRNPKANKIAAFFQEDDVLYKVKTYQEKGFVFAPFDVKEDIVLIPFVKSNFFQEAYKDEVVVEREVCGAVTSSKEFHINLVGKSIEAIRNEEFKKVVLSRKESVKTKDLDVLTTFKRLLSKYKNAFVYAWYHPKVGLWMGATPETLIKIEEDVFETMSLAGTQVYSGASNVIWGAKELDEQQLVTDYVLQKLQKLTDEVAASPVETIKAGNLLHLKTTIKGVFNKKVSELIGALHPTPAVCGFPKEASKKFIVANEGYDRRFYTGFLGVLNMPNSQLYVNLRCMEVQEGFVDVFVGGGITVGSDAEKEWNETVAKAITMKSVL